MSKCILKNKLCPFFFKAKRLFVGQWIAAHLRWFCAHFGSISLFSPLTGKRSCAEQHSRVVLNNMMYMLTKLPRWPFFPPSTSNKGVCWSWINSRELNRFLHTALIVIVTSSIFSTIWMHIAPIWIYIPTTSHSVSPTVWKESIFPLSVYELHYDPAGFDCHGSSTSQIQRLLA